MFVTYLVNCGLDDWTRLDGLDGKYQIQILKNNVYTVRIFSKNSPLDKNAELKIYYCNETMNIIIFNVNCMAINYTSSFDFNMSNSRSIIC